MLLPNLSKTGVKYTCICTVSARSCQASLPAAAKQDARNGDATVVAASSAAAPPTAADANSTAAATAAVDPSVECGGNTTASSSSDSLYQAALDALFTTSNSSTAAAAPPVRASLRLLPAAPIAAARAVVAVAAEQRPLCAAWVPERLQQRLVEGGCRVHFGGGASCVVARLEPPAPAGALHRIVRSTLVEVVAEGDPQLTSARP